MITHKVICLQRFSIMSPFHIFQGNCFPNGNKSTAFLCVTVNNKCISCINFACGAFYCLFLNSIIIVSIPFLSVFQHTQLWYVANDFGYQKAPNLSIPMGRICRAPNHSVPRGPHMAYDGPKCECA